jgi:hypothetical protein
MGNNRLPKLPLSYKPNGWRHTNTIQNMTMKHWTLDVGIRPCLRCQGWASQLILKHALSLFETQFPYHPNYLNSIKFNNINLKLNTLHARRRYFDVLFIRNVYNSFVTCPSLLQTVWIRVPNKNSRDSILSTLCFHAATFFSLRLTWQWYL